MAKADKKSPYDKWSYEDAAAKYSVSAALIKNDDTGSLKPFFNKVAAYMQKYGKPPTQAQFDKWSLNYEWFSKYDSGQQEALKQKYDPLTAKDYANSVESLKSQIKYVADNMGAPVSDSALATMAEQAKFNGWTDYEIREQLAPMVAAAATAGSDLMGAAGDAQTVLKQWMNQNGIAVNDQDIAPYVQRIAAGQQSIDDVKADMRKTYMTGMYPAWSDRIAEGVDPAALAAPYKHTIAGLLEVDDSSVGFDDPLLKKAMQGIGADGKPAVVPMYQFEQMVRQDPRWDKTNNAYSTYAKVGNDLLRTFGIG